MTGDGVRAKLNHVGISVRDLDVARAFWLDGLGAEFHGEFSWPVGTSGADESLALQDTAASVVLLRTEAAFMELFRFSSPAQQVRPSRSPGVSALTWAVVDPVAAIERALEHGGKLLSGSYVVSCPDGTPVAIVEAGDGPLGLIGVTIRVSDASAFPFALAGPVTVPVESGASEVVPSPVDLGANHVCLDVDDAYAARATSGRVDWHHPVTSSSGGLALVCYGTTHDGVLVELLESRGPEAFFSRTRLARADG